MKNFDSEERYIPERSKINRSLTFEKSFKIRSFVQSQEFSFSTNL